MQSLICGLDEAGRGPLAGPVVAGAVILPDDFPIEILNDSKKLTQKKREAAEIIIKQKAFWGVGIVDNKTIDEINILQASLLAMKKAFENMTNFFSLNADNISVFVDGTFCPSIACKNITAEPKADGKYPSVMAASIIAKVERDRIMLDLDKLYPEYKYSQHKGYPTPEHKNICKKIGPSPIQRMTFKY